MSTGAGPVPASATVHGGNIPCQTLQRWRSLGREFIAPRICLLLEAATSGKLPFRFGREDASPPIWHTPAHPSMTYVSRDDDRRVSSGRNPDPPDASSRLRLSCTTSLRREPSRRQARRAVLVGCALGIRMISRVRSDSVRYPVAVHEFRGTAQFATANFINIEGIELSRSNRAFSVLGEGFL